MKHEDIERIMTAVGRLRDYSEEAGRLKGESREKQILAVQQMDVIRKILDADKEGDHGTP